MKEVLFLTTFLIIIRLISFLVCLISSIDLIVNIVKKKKNKKSIIIIWAVALVIFIISNIFI